MKAMIFAAGLGTRLRPLTDHQPKALVPVAGKPMLEHVIRRLISAGCTELIINIHHFGKMILDFLEAHNHFGITIHVSDERDFLLDTGGGILKAASFLQGDEPILIHNVDILSNVDLHAVYEAHIRSGNQATLVVSERQTARYFVFDTDHRLRGWINIQTGQTKPAGFSFSPQHMKYAFSGIHVISPSLISLMKEKGWSGKFSITDFYLGECAHASIYAHLIDGLEVIDIGKPETLANAARFVEGTPPLSQSLT